MAFCRLCTGNEWPPCTHPSCHGEWGWCILVLRWLYGKSGKYQRNILILLFSVNSVYEFQYKWFHILDYIFMWSSVSFKYDYGLYDYDYEMVTILFKYEPICYHSCTFRELVKLFYFWLLNQYKTWVFSHFCIHLHFK